MLKIEFSETPKFRKILRSFCDKAYTNEDISDVVNSVLSDIRSHGDLAVLDYTKKFDGAELKAKSMRVSAKEIKSSLAFLNSIERKALRTSISLVKEFHKKTVPKNWKVKNTQGGEVGERFYPINRVGLYIPGGNVPLVSTVVMTAVLAKLVKCPEIAVCTPPDKDGKIAPSTLAALSMIGI